MKFHPRLLAIALAIGPVSAASASVAGDSTDELIGIEIEGALGEELGQIGAVSPTPDGDAAVLVEASGMLDLGHAVFTVRRSQLKPGPADEVLTYPVTAAEIRRMVRNANRVAVGQWVTAPRGSLP